MENEQETTLVKEQTECEQSTSQECVYEHKKSVISESLRKLNELTAALNDVCKKALELAHASQELEKIAEPEKIGNSIRLRKPNKKIFDTSGYLVESLTTFNEIFSIYSSKIKTETSNEFDNFIMQVVNPSHEELSGVYEHNDNIIEEFRKGFLSLMNHFYVLGAELLEKFLTCGECTAPIGFTHQLSCSAKGEQQFKWKRVTFDDKFITFDMQFNFNDLLDPKRRKEIIKLIEKTAVKQISIGNRGKTSLPMEGRSAWPSRWSRHRRTPRSVRGRGRRSYPMHIVQRPIFNPTPWTPMDNELEQMKQNFECMSFVWRTHE